jgi:hypothetical protein
VAIVTTLEATDTVPFTATIFFTALCSESATYTSPAALSATPVGVSNPLPTGSTTELADTMPLTAITSFTALLPVSATNTSPEPSTATECG